LNDQKRNLIVFRILLYIFFLMIPSYIAVASSAPVALIAIWVLGLIAVGSLSYWPGYIAMLVMLAAEAATNAPLFVFAPCFCLMLMFVIGTSSVARYWGVATQLISGTTQNITGLYSPCVRRFQRVFLAVTSIGLALSFAYAIFPTVVPTSTDPSTLAVYVAIALIGMAIILQAGSS
jgi:hypothetical protein